MPNGISTPEFWSDYQNDVMRHAVSHETQDPEFIFRHFICGVLGELGEMADAIKRYSIYEKWTRKQYLDNLKEEIGDLLWYGTYFCTFYPFDKDQTKNINFPELATRIFGENPEGALCRSERISELATEEMVAVTTVTESFLMETEAIRKAIHVLVSVRELCFRFEFAPDEVANRNRRKLQARAEANAITDRDARDYEAEQKAASGS